MALQINEQESGGFVRDPDHRLIVVQASAGGFLAQLPPNATAQNIVGSNAANASATATIPGTAGKTTYITGFTVEGLGATAGTVVIATITGLATSVNGGTLSFPVAIPTGATTRVSVQQSFGPFPASAVNTAIVVTVPAAGAGNTNMSVTAYGYQL